jgi:mRNA interferase RelE/StbE
MPEGYDLAWTPTAKRDLATLPEKVATAAVEFVYGGLSVNPQRVGHRLQRELAGMHAARRGDFRVLYRIDEPERLVTIMAIDHRADIYRRR